MPLESAPPTDRIINRHQPRASSLYTPGIRVAIVDVLVAMVRGVNVHTMLGKFCKGSISPEYGAGTVAQVFTHWAFVSQQYTLQLVVYRFAATMPPSP